MLAEFLTVAMVAGASTRPAPRPMSLSRAVDAKVSVTHATWNGTGDEGIPGWTPYAGRQVTGRPAMTFSRGRLVARDGRPVGEPGWGEFLPGGGARPGSVEARE